MQFSVAFITFHPVVLVFDSGVLVTANNQCSKKIKINKSKTYKYKYKDIDIDVYTYMYTYVNTFMINFTDIRNS